MKKTVFFGGIIMLAVALGSCDYVDTPTPVGGGVNSSCDSVFSVTVPVSMTKNVLLEDFSGHKCPNCPSATAEAESIHSSVGDRLVSVTIHPDPNLVPTLAQFVNESPAGSGSYETVWYIPAGGELINYFGNPGYLPVGMIDRTIQSGNNRFFDPSVWNTTVNNRLMEPLEVTLAGKAELLSDGITVCGQAKTEFLSAMNPVDDIRIVHYLVEDSISDWQLDGSTNLPNYWHRHVLRAVYANFQGETVVSAGPVSAGTTTEHSFSFDTYTVVNPDYLEVITFVYDLDSEEVLQVIKYDVDN